MTRRIALPLLSLAAALALSSCGPGASTNGQDVAANDMAADNVAAADVESGNLSAPVAVVDVPVAAPDAPVADVAPLKEAASTAAAIENDQDRIVRVAQGDGWAWKQRGQVIRTATRDGSRVSYFHPGEDHPYLVQDGGKTYGYDGDRVSHVFGRDGRPQTPDADNRREADRLKTEARADHAQADRAPSRRDTDIDGKNATRPDRGAPDERDRDNRPGASSTPAPTPTATPTRRTGSRENDPGRTDSTPERPRDRSGDAGNSTAPRP